MQREIKRERAGAEPVKLFVLQTEVEGGNVLLSTQDSHDDEWDSVRPVK